MPHRKLIALVVALLLLGGVGVFLATRRSPAPARTAAGASDRPSTDADAGKADDADASGDPDGGDTTDLRLQALHDAAAAGTLGVDAVVPRTAPAGWSGEHVVSHRYDDWEPAIAADPHAPYVYRLVTRYGGPKACKQCPDPAIVLQVSRNDGRTWGPSRFLCRCKGTTGQYDPQIEVVADTGAVDASFMRGYSVWFTRSSDHGRTWSKAVPVAPAVAWQDKDILAPAANGTDVYIAFNGPTDGDAWVSSSHDGGSTWSPVKVTNSKRYLYAFGGHVLADGTVVFSESSLLYANARDLVGNTREVAIRSTDGGTTWHAVQVDVLQLGRVCTSKGCPADFYDGHSALGLDGRGRLLMVVDGAVRPRRPRRIYAYLSTDEGKTWGPRILLSIPGVNAGFPAVTGTPNGRFLVWFMDQRTGRWNVWFRRSADTRTWSRALKLSNAIGGAVYKSRAGFLEAYGDYGEIDVTDRGTPVAIWGEGPSYAGPGGCWYTRRL